MTLQAGPGGLDRYRDDRFGMFVHWGLYSMIGRGEWEQVLARIPAAEYAPLARLFNPAAFDARELVALAEAAGQRYLTVTSRHHDGFSMYDTALSDFRITRSPFGRDPIAELADACRESGSVRLGFYVSLVDWHHPGYLDASRWEDYLAFLFGQVEELCTRYGDVAQIWFDGDWPNSPVPLEHPGWFTTGGQWRYPELYDLVHRLQPDAVILNNRKDGLQPGEDVQGFENDLPGENTTGLNPGAALAVPRETCLTMNGSWGYVPHDTAYKEPEGIIATLLRCVAADSNLLLNVGPTQSGDVPAPARERLREIGRWLRAHGDAVYGAGPGPEPGSIRTRDGRVLDPADLLPRS